MQPKIWATVACFFLLTIIIFLSLQEIFLSSQLEADIQILENKNEPFSRRVVLIVSDGLRSDFAFRGWKNENTSEILMPKLKEIVKKGENVFCAISQTQAPTESRVCHTAMLAGFWEDMSDIFVQWKRHFYTFDHVLDKAKKAWAFGGPDVVNYFTGGNVTIEAFPYNNYHSVKDTEELDLWSFEKYKNLLETSSITLELKAAGSIFFLHLAGVDTAGHRHEPFSLEYEKNTKHVDDLIANIITVTENFFADNKTTYIFTSDHGFPDHGSHGGSEPSTISSPLVIWGTDIFKKTGVDTCRNNVVSQLSINVLISMILGISYSTNNREVIPIRHLNVDAGRLADNMKTNYEQMYTLYEKKKCRLSRQSPYVDLLCKLFLFRLEMRTPNSYQHESSDERLLFYQSAAEQVSNYISLLELLIPKTLKFIFFAAGISMLSMESKISLKNIYTMKSLSVAILVGLFVKISFSVVASAGILIPLIFHFRLRFFKWNQIMLAILALACFSFGTIYPHIISSSLLLVFYRGNYFISCIQALKLLMPLLVLLLSTFIPPNTKVLMIAGNTIALAVTALNQKRNRKEPQLFLRILLVTATMASFFMKTGHFHSFLSLGPFFVHLGSCFFINIDNELIGVHMISVLASGRQMFVFILLYVLIESFPEIDNETYAPLNSTNIDQDSEKFLKSVRIFVTMGAMIFLPIGLNPSSNEAKIDYRRYFNHSTAISMVLTKLTALVFLLHKIQKKTGNGYELMHMYHRWVSCSVISTFFVLCTMSTSESWLNIGLGIARFTVSLCLPHIVAFIWILAKCLPKKSK